MPVSKPIQIYEIPELNAASRARRGAAGRIGRVADSNGGDVIESFAKALAGSGQMQGGGKMTGAAKHHPKPSVQAMRGAGINPDTAVSMADLINLGAMQKAMQQSKQPLAIADSVDTLASGLARALPNPARGIGALMDEAAVLAVKAASHRKRPDRAGGKESADETEKTAGKVHEDMMSTLGRLSGFFESGGSGSMAIGYDRAGGTSYGKYQISSKTGTFGAFVDFLAEKAPDLAARFKNGGPANTGSRSGKMPEIWKRTAAENPERFEELQFEFIKENHFDPAMRRLSRKSGVDEAALGPVLKDVLFSTAVQHGAAAAGRIMDRALKAVGLELFASNDQKVAKKAEQDVIREVYGIRSGQFSSSSAKVRSSVQSRLRTEMNMALNMLGTSRMA